MSGEAAKQRSNQVRLTAGMKRAESSLKHLFHSTLLSMLHGWKAKWLQSRLKESGQATHLALNPTL